MKHALWRLALSGCVTGVYLWAGASKLADPAAFAFAIDNYRLLPWPAAVGVAHALPWLEIVAALALWVSRWRAGALGILTGLGLVFVVALGSAMVRGLDIACGCFGAGGGGGSGLGWALVRAIGLSVVCGGLLVAEMKAMGGGRAAGGKVGGE